MRKPAWTRVLPPLALTFVLVWIYRGLLRFDPLLYRDDLLILRWIKTPAHFWQLLRGEGVGALFVYQPLRDATLFADLWLSNQLTRTLGHIQGSFHFTNLAIWFGCVAAFSALLKKVTQQKSPSAMHWGWVALFALHPVTVGSVAWIAARKHLLAVLGGLLATLAVWSGQWAWGITAYLLSLLAQPILILLPIAWVLIRRPPRRTLLALIGIGLTVGTATLIYYASTYAVHTQASKFPAASAWELFQTTLLAWGRYTFNLIVPVCLATVYAADSLTNLIGLVLLGAFVFLLATKKVRSTRSLKLFLMLLVLPILPVTVRMTQIFVSDTYALFSVAAFVLVMREATLKFPPKAVSGLVIVTLCCYGLLSERQARTWSSDYALWTHAATVEPQFRSLNRRALEEIRVNDYPGAWKTLSQLEAFAPTPELKVELALLIAHWTSSNPAMSSAEKLDALKTLPIDAQIHPLMAYYRSGILEESGQITLAWEEWTRLYEHPSLWIETFAKDSSTAFAEVEWTCQRLRPHIDCPLILKPLREKLAQVWDDRLYETQRQRLRDRD